MSAAPGKPLRLWFMHPAIPLLVVIGLTVPLMAAEKHAAPKPAARKSLLDSDPEVVYLEQVLKQPVDLKVIQNATVFSDKEGHIRLGILKAEQTVRLEAITDKVYKVRGQGVRDGIAGWVAPSSFSSTDPQFVAHLKQLYQRQIQVRKLLEAKQIAVGMTPDEVSQVCGKPTKTTVRKTGKGESGLWEFVDYVDINHYVTRVDPVTRQEYRQLSYVEHREKGRTNVEFQDGLVTAIEESENRKAHNVSVIVPPLVSGW